MRTPTRPARYPFVALTALCLSLACGGNSKPSAGNTGGTSSLAGQASTESAMGGGGSTAPAGTGGGATGGAGGNPTGAAGQASTESASGGSTAAGGTGGRATGGAGGNLTGGIPTSGRTGGAGTIASTGGTTPPGGSFTPGLAVLAGVPSDSGSADGTGTAARFTWPSGVAVDSVGNTFIADRRNHNIRRITPAGVVTTVAGTAYVRGNADGTGADARFDTPIGIAVDGTGNLFVADTYNHTIRKITPAGVVTTVAGKAGMTGSSDGTGADARFNKPAAMVVDGAGNLFVADTSNYTVRKITPAGVVTTIAGAAGESGNDDGTGTGARFDDLMGIAVDGAGNLLVTSTDTIRRITPAGVVTTLAGTSGSYGSADGTGYEARFAYAQGIAADGAGNFIVADNHTIRKVTANGVVTTLAGSTASFGMTNVPRADALLRQPGGLAVDSTANLFVADTHNSVIRKVSPAGVMTTLAGKVGSSETRDGTGTDARFGLPEGLALDGAGNVFIADSSSHVIRQITPDGVVTTLAGTAGSPGYLSGVGDRAKFNSPKGVAVDGAGNVFVADTVNDCIRKITPAGAVTTFAGGRVTRGNKDGTGTEAGFSRPSGLALDRTGNLIVADTDNHTIRKITPAGVVTTFAGTAGAVGSADGMGTEARFNVPQGVAVDGAGNVFVADTNNHAIRKITAAGLVSTVVGVASPTEAGNLPGPLPGLLAFPRGVAVDSSASYLYITLDDAIMVAVFSR